MKSRIKRVVAALAFAYFAAQGITFLQSLFQDGVGYIGTEEKSWPQLIPTADMHAVGWPAPCDLIIAAMVVVTSVLIYVRPKAGALLVAGLPLAFIAFFFAFLGDAFMLIVPVLLVAYVVALVKRYKTAVLFVTPAIVMMVGLWALVGYHVVFDALINPCCATLQQYR